MSGPVWRKFEDEEARCDECLQLFESGLREGEIIDGEFKPGRTLCEGCYQENIELIARL